MSNATTQSNILGVIPARWDSSRFPGKPLHPIAGKPMIQHVWERCQLAEKLAATIIATDDERIAKTATAFGARVKMTSSEHLSGTDRIAEAIATENEFSHVINIQGDEPLINAGLIDQIATKLSESPAISMITAALPFVNHLDLANPNIVKTVITRDGQALYFSRSVIPYQDSKNQVTTCYRHKGIYGYTKEFLLKFVRWEPSPLELAEKLEQLRALENGAQIHVVITDDDSSGVDTPEQADVVEQLLLANH
ncbi:MAG: 3-deoxy-manno-octulosonate cytidylyltransferase [Verrucomicrobiaceae bacterium]|nr:3-deoxy-manno-octulosonate cytidylyltransferase [Verrucomicrobiaceae bacterium]